MGRNVYGFSIKGVREDELMAEAHASMRAPGCSSVSSTEMQTVEVAEVAATKSE